MTRPTLTIGVGAAETRTVRHGDFGNDCPNTGRASTVSVRVSDLYVEVPKLLCSSCYNELGDFS